MLFSLIRSRLPGIMIPTHAIFTETKIFSAKSILPLDSFPKMKYLLCKHLHSRLCGGRMESKMRTYLQINPKDNVAVALAPLSSGTSIELDGITLTLSEDIPQGHKFALKDFAAGEKKVPAELWGELVRFRTLASQVSRMLEN